MYNPSFKCPHCEKVIDAKMSGSTTMAGLAHGAIAACSCQESKDAWEREHRARIELRKQATRPAKRRSRRRKK